MSEVKGSPPNQEQPSASSIPPLVWNYPGPSVLQAIVPFTTIGVKYGGGKMLDCWGCNIIRNYTLICDEGIILAAFSDSRELKCCDCNRPRDPIFLQDLSGIPILRVDVSATCCSRHDEINVSAPPGNHIGTIHIKINCCSRDYVVNSNYTAENLIVETVLGNWCKYNSYCFKLENGELKATVKRFQSGGSILQIYSPIDPVMKALLISFLLTQAVFAREEAEAAQAAAAAQVAHY